MALPGHHHVWKDEWIKAFTKRPMIYLAGDFIEGGTLYSGDKHLGKEMRMKKGYLKHGQRCTCVIDGESVTDARISINRDGNVHICQNVQSGNKAEDLLGYRCSWLIAYSNTREEVDDGLGAHYVTDFKLIEKKSIMKKTRVHHGDSCTCVIRGIRMDDAKISINPKGRVFICQNKKFGTPAPDRLGYTKSWFVSASSDPDIFAAGLTKEGVTDFRLVRKDTYNFAVQANSTKSINSAINELVRLKEETKDASKIDRAITKSVAKFEEIKAIVEDTDKCGFCNEYEDCDDCPIHDRRAKDCCEEYEDILLSIEDMIAKIQHVKRED